MNKKSLSLGLLFVPIVVVIGVFLTNAVVAAQIRTNPDAISQSTLDTMALVFGVLGIISLICAIVGGVMFVLAMRPQKK